MPLVKYCPRSFYGSMNGIYWYGAQKCSDPSMCSTYVVSDTRAHAIDNACTECVFPPGAPDCSDPIWVTSAFAKGVSKRGKKKSRRSTTIQPEIALLNSIHPESENLKEYDNYALLGESITVPQKGNGKIDKTTLAANKGFDPKIFYTGDPLVRLSKDMVVQVQGKTKPHYIRVIELVVDVDASPSTTVSAFVRIGAELDTKPGSSDEDGVVAANGGEKEFDDRFKIAVGTPPKLYYVYAKNKLK